MGFLDKLRGTETEEHKAPPRAVVAAAMPMSGPGVRRINRGRQQSTQEQWQVEAWYYWVSVGELRAPTVWIANAVSQADLHASTLDADTGKPTGPSELPQSIAVANQALGGANQRAGLLRTIALCWQVVGEAWIIIRPNSGAGQPDTWLVLSGNKVSAKGESWQYTDPYTLEFVTLGARDRLIRVWCPHPNDQSKADSSVRAALPILREIEKGSQNIAARLDSRIATNGVMALAEDLDFPKGDFETSAAAFTDFFMQAAEAGLANPGQASSQVPLAFTAPGELIANGGAFAHFDLSTEFDQNVVVLRDNGRDRLAATLDMPKGVADQTQTESNHWSAWQVEESTYKIFIEPLLKAIGDPITTEWFRPSLELMGVAPDAADREEIAWDTTAIVARPDDTENLRDLYDKVLISDEYMLTENGVPEDAMPDSAERTRRVLEKIVIGAPSLLSDPAVAKALGLDIEVQPVAAGVDATVTPGGELEAPEPPPVVNALPGTQGDQPADVPEGLVAAAEVLVMQALDRAGGRLLTNQNRGQFKDVPRHELYRHIKPEAPGSLVDVRFADGVAEAFGMRPAMLCASLQVYVSKLLSTGTEHTRDELTWMLR
jgi:hypothetical protein